MPYHHIQSFPDRNSLYENIFTKEGIGCEVGVLLGENAAALARITRPAKLHLIDRWEGHVAYAYDVVKRRFHSHMYHPGFESTIEIHQGHSTVELAKLADQSLDWCYIDADHHYHGASGDIKAALPKVKKGGILAGHDFVCYEPDFKSGVVRAVLELIQTGAVYLVAISDELFATWAVKVIDPNFPYHVDPEALSSNP